MIYRMIMDIEADDKEMALAKLDDAVEKAIAIESTVAELFRIEENPFDETEETTVLELARGALGEASTFYNFADELDVKDDVLKDLQKKLEDKMEHSY